MKFSYLAPGIFGAAFLLAVCSTSVSANQPLKIQPEIEQTDSDSLKVEYLAKELKKLKPISSSDFKTKFKKEINGFKLTDVQSLSEQETGSSATANYAKGDQSIYIMVTDGAGPGAEQVKQSLLNYLELKKIEEPGDKTYIKNYKGWMVYFDYSMFENDGLVSIQYLEGNRFSVVASGNNVPIEELKKFLDGFSL